MVLAGADVPPEARRGYTHFKLGFGGRVVLLPRAYDRLYRPMIAGPLRYASPHLQWVARRLSGRHI
jgi:hypothetical protein